MMKNTMHAVNIANLSFRYNATTPTIFTIKKWELAQHTHTFLYGPSGSGKSTLLNLVCGIITPQQGDITILGTPLNTLKPRQRDAFRAQHIGVIFQEFNLIPFLTIRENIELAAHFSRRKPQKDLALIKDKTKELCERLKLHEQLLSQRADSLSVGQRQRVSIVRALVNSPEFLIADEPTSALDAENREEFIHVLLEIGQQSGCTILFVSHDEALRSNFSHQQDIRTIFETHNDF